MNKVGLCIMFDILSLELAVYVLESYELAKQQAEELAKGTPSEFISETTDTNNGSKQCGYTCGTELMLVRETEIGLTLIPTKIKI